MLEAKIEWTHEGRLHTVKVANTYATILTHWEDMVVSRERTGTLFLKEGGKWRVSREQVVNKN